MSTYTSLLKTNPRLAENFDEQFKKLNVELTPRSRDADMIFQNMTGDEFKGFSWADASFLSELECNEAEELLSAITCDTKL